MKILTWNILASEWIKPEYYPTVNDFRIMDSDQRISIIVQQLLTENADIILLQEVTDAHYDVLYLRFNKQYYISSLRPIQWDKSHSSSGNITLIRKNIGKTISEHPLEYGILVKADQITIYNIHLNDVSMQKRKKQIDLLRPTVQKEKYVILGGDFNEEYTKSSSIYTFPGVTVHNKGITYFVEKNMNIDNILTKGFFVSKSRCSYVPKTVTEGLRTYGSDHIPVTAVIQKTNRKTRRNVLF
jgi:endonuclease/exonuclease/phosphatase family metal-dependent hydrolase